MKKKGERERERRKNAHASEKNNLTAMMMVTGSTQCSSILTLVRKIL